MALNYTQGVKNIMLSMSLDKLTPSGVGIGYGFGFRYSGSATGSVTGAYQLSNNYLLSNGTGSLHIYIPTGSYLNLTTTTSESISNLVAKYSGSSVDDKLLSTYIVVLQDSINPFPCDASCYQGESVYWYYNGTLNPPTIQNPANRLTTRVLKGGVSITSTVKYPPYGPGAVGTMGLVCQDSASGALVGLTNNHVIIRDPFYTNQQNTSSVIQNEYYLNDSTNTTPNMVYQTGETLPIVSGSLEIGRVLRYVPLYTSASTSANPTKINNSDAAIFSLYCSSSTGTPIIGFTSSFQQVGLSYTSSMPFASTAEINNLFNTNPELYSSGRTTGAKGSPGTLCPLRFFSMADIAVPYNLQGTPTLAYMQDVIAFVKPENSASYLPSGSGGATSVCPYPCYAGDSGSTLIANFSGTWKIIGLVFAGDASTDIYYTPSGVPGLPAGLPYRFASSMGFACRIDNVATQLGIKAWTGSAAPVVDHNTINYITTTGSNDISNLICSGSRYWQLGLTHNHKLC